MVSQATKIFRRANDDFVTNFENRNEGVLMLSIFLKAIIILLALYAVIDAALDCKPEFWFNFLLFFSVWSNILVVIVLLTIIIFLIVQYFSFTVVKPSRFFSISHLAVSVSAIIAGLSFCLFNTPLDEIMNNDAAPLFGNFQQLCLYFLVPMLSFFDLIIFTGYKKVKYKHNFWTLLIPLCYLIFAIISYYTKVPFDQTLDSKCYPYDFLNFDSSVGWFGIDLSEPNMFYRIGSFYWIISIGIIFYLVGIISIFIIRFVFKHVALPIAYGISKERKNEKQGELYYSIIKTWSILLDKIFKINKWDEQYVKLHNITSLMQINNLRKKNILSETDFAMLTRLRHLRNDIAHQEGKTVHPRTTLYDSELKSCEAINRKLDNYLKKNK